MDREREVGKAVEKSTDDSSEKSVLGCSSTTSNTAVFRAESMVRRMLKKWLPAVADL